ncbi:DUF6214 family protein [Kocuria sp. KH4]
MPSALIAYAFTLGGCPRRVKTCLHSQLKYSTMHCMTPEFTGPQGLASTPDGQHQHLTVTTDEGAQYMLVIPTVRREDGSPVWDNLVEVGPGVHAPRHVVLTAGLVADGVERARVAITAAPSPHGFTARGVRVDAMDDAEVTGELLRQVPVASMLQECWRVLLLDLPAEVAPYLADPGAERWEHLRQQWPSGPESHVAVAVVAHAYRLAVATGTPPTQHVADLFTVSRATAGRMIARARRDGLLDPAERRWTGGTRATRN